MQAELPQLYLVCPANADESFLRQLAEATADAPVASLCLSMDFTDEGLAKKRLKLAGDLFQPQGTALLLDAGFHPLEAARLAIDTELDGVHLRFGSNKALEAARIMLQPNKIAGIGSLRGRDDAMSAGEAGFDYMMFGEPQPEPLSSQQLCEKIAWWAEIFNTPCVAYAQQVSEIAPLCLAGAEFIGLGREFWQENASIAATLQQARAALQPLPER